MIQYTYNYLIRKIKRPEKGIVLVQTKDGYTRLVFEIYLD